MQQVGANPARVPWNLKEKVPCNNALKPPNLGRKMTGFGAIVALAFLGSAIEPRRLPAITTKPYLKQGDKRR
ncbi:MAG TPA: hypothetical protein DCM48_27295 [Thalassospira sp.]|nr:hypothetical protein [Thalassospira sp.]